MYKNVVIICIDSLRADGTSYTYNRVHKNTAPFRTPHLDALLKSGTVYDTYSTNTYTTAAHASLFTGSYPFEHGIRAFFDFQQKLSASCETLAESLTKEGFQTFFYTDVPALFSEMDIWRGFRIKTHERMNWLYSSIQDLKKRSQFCLYPHI